MKIFNKFDKKVKQPFCGYVLGLIFGTKKRICIHMAHVSKIGQLYRLLSKTNQLIPIIPQLMVSAVNHFAKTKPGHLIIDDTFMSKVFSKLLAGLYTMYNTAMCRPERGLSIVVICWSNGEITIPIKFDWLFHKDIVRKEYYETKSEIAIRLLKFCIGKIQFSYCLMDGHYSTKKLMRFLQRKKNQFIAKIARNRVIESMNGIRAQINKHSLLKLVKNNRSKRLKVKYANIMLYISVHKRKNKKGEYAFLYIACNKCLTAKTYLSKYEER